MMNSGTLVDRRLEAGHGDKVAIRCAGEEVTYAQLHDRICAAGNVLSQRGIGREDRVLMILDDTPTFPTLFLGAMRIGAVPAPVSFLDTTENFAHYARDSYAKLIVAEDHLLGRLPEGAMSRTAFEELLRSHAGLTDPADTHPDDMAFWLFSGGSTGFPKGVVHLHHDIPYTCETFAKEILKITERDVTFSSTKLYHAYGLGNNLTFPYWVGATTVLRMGKPEPRGLLETAQANRPSLFFSVPTLYGAMVNLPDAEEYDLSSVRFCVSAAEPLAPEVYRRWKQTFDLDIVDGIGSTEMLHIYCSNRPGEVQPGTSGKPVPGYELVLLDELGQPVSQGEVGNLHVRGDSALAYYWHQHEKTKAAVKGDLFFTGDRYRENEDGYFVYEGRADDMIKIGGLWASPIEIENALVEHPRVLEAAAVGVDADYTTRVKAFVICRGEAGDEALVAELQEWCKSRLRRYEFPHFITFVDDLPKTPTGKIQRYKLREEA
ncbi:benzoate-CoA ligase family protein [Solirubrobacter ginsenosidimutans]|uniref:Benzoate-CoA ligase family protein n=1 Tax=Solirubrobacter ginsenosidimutans TaxID=490573 RepID=A0A9X3MV53_9ACTN|nr:benzoate-CoA ligase family protein [Solirubrobacter ginsenosidimutans]MDA0163090.1 benzoate-CoA ligase family protein [Solirubrobacter ginsenosidimutans]